MASINVKKNFELTEVVEKITDKMANDLQTALLNLRTKIVFDASQGKGFEGNSLKPYSSGYKKMRVDAGYSANVNLTITGQMLRDVQLETPPRRDANGVTFRIFIANGSSIPPKGFGSKGVAVSSVEKAMHTMAQRPWFGLSEQAKKELLDILRR